MRAQLRTGPSCSCTTPDRAQPYRFFGTNPTLDFLRRLRNARTTPALEPGLLVMAGLARRDFDWPRGIRCVVPLDSGPVPRSGAQRIGCLRRLLRLARGQPVPFRSSGPDRMPQGRKRVGFRSADGGRVPHLNRHRSSSSRYGISRGLTQSGNKRGAVWLAGRLQNSRCGVPLENRKVYVAAISTSISGSIATSRFGYASKISLCRSTWFGASTVITSA